MPLIYDTDMQSQPELVRCPGVKVRAIQPGSWVKIDRNGERFWVMAIDQVSGSGTFAGIIDNELDQRNPLCYSDTLSISINEVLETLTSSALHEFLDLVRKGREIAPGESREATETIVAMQWRQRRLEDGSGAVPVPGARLCVP